VGVTALIVLFATSAEARPKAATTRTSASNAWNSSFDRHILERAGARDGSSEERTFR